MSLLNDIITLSERAAAVINAAASVAALAGVEVPTSTTVLALALHEKYFEVSTGILVYWLPLTIEPPDVCDPVKDCMANMTFGDVAPVNDPEENLMSSFLLWPFNIVLYAELKFDIVKVPTSLLES
ncbi:MAG: hypothetical protein BWY32_03477 [bacterium ADurb.Bin243]|nr:MAG: hypothetical protein BWY32_03477 [bacterium ADurb.Bin243]